VESPDLDPKMNSYPLDEVSHSPRIRVDRPVINQMVLFPKYDPHKGFMSPDDPDDPGKKIRNFQDFKF